MLEHSNYDTIVQQLLEVEAQVTVTPHVKHGKPKTFCVESDILPCCDSEKEKEENLETAARKCCFTVTQVICVEIPITFDVEVDVDKGIVYYCKPDFGPCELRELPNLPEPHELKEPAKPPKLINLLSILKLISPRNLRNLFNMDILRNSLYHIDIFPNIMHYKIRKVCIPWRILVVVETPAPSQYIERV